MSKNKYLLGDRGAVDMTGQEGGDAPRNEKGNFVAHWAIRVGAEEVWALKPGMIVYIVNGDPRFAENIFPTVVEELSLKRIVLRLYSLDKSSSKRLIYNASQKGQFVPSFKDKHEAQAKRIEEIQEAAEDADDEG
jgi:hypothetical protein